MIPPPPPLALLTMSDPKADCALDEAWAEAEEILLRTGLAEARSLAVGSRGRLSPNSITALAEFYLANKSRWRGPGALAWRLREFREGQDPADLALWPPANPEFVKRQRDAAAAGANAARAAQIDDDAARARAERLANAERERRFGAILDALDATALDELAARALPPFARRRYASELANPPPKSAMLRVDLLLAIERERGTDGQVP